MAVSLLSELQQSLIFSEESFSTGIFSVFFLEYYPSTHHWAQLKVPPFHLLAVVFSATVISFKNLFPKLRK